MELTEQWPVLKIGGAALTIRFRSPLSASDIQQLSVGEDHYYKKNACSKQDNFFVGAAGDRAAPTVGVLGTYETRRPYKWYSRGGW